MFSLQRLALWMIFALAVFAGVDHLQWALECSLPLSRGDSPRHALFALTRAHQGSGLLGLRLLLEPTYYPSLVPWLAWPVLVADGATGSDYRAFLAVFSGLFTLGCGLAARRLGGDLAGVVGAALSLAVPVLWTLREELMLDGPLAAMVVLLLAVVPLEVTTRRRVVLAGLVLAAGLLTKQTMPYLAAPLLGVLGLRAVWEMGAGVGARLGVIGAVGAGLAVAGGLYLEGLGWAGVGVATVVLAGVAAGGARAGEGRLAQLAVVGLVAILVAGPWYARSVGPVLEGLVVTRADHADVPSLTSWSGAMRALSMVRFGVLGLLPAPVVWLALAGMVGVVWRGRVLGLGAVASAVLGSALIASFPDLHGRHFAPVAGPLVVLAASAVGMVGARWPWLGRVVAAPLVAFGLVFALAWRVPGESVYRVSSVDAEIPGNATAHELGELGRLLVQPLGVGTYLSATPPQGELPVHAALERVVADRVGVPVVLLSRSTMVEGDALLLGVEELRLSGFIVPDRVGPAEAIQGSEGANGVYVVELVAKTERSRGPYRKSRELVQLGFVELERWPAAVPGAPGLELVLSRWRGE